MTTHRVKRAGAMALSGAAILIAPIALAAPDPALAYRAPAGCPTEADFVAAVGARGGSLESAAPASEMDVSVERAEGGYSGLVRVKRGDVISAPRAVHGATCSEVVDALAVVTALALRADAESDVPATTAPAPSEPKSIPAPPAPLPKAKPVAKPRRPPLKAEGSFPTPFHPGNVEMEVAAGTLRLESVTSVSMLGGVALGVVPGVVMPRIDVQLSRANFVTVPEGRSYITGPIFRSRISLLANVEYRSGEATTTIGGESAAIGLCYSPYFDSGGLELLLCGEVGIGIMGTETRDAPGAKAHTKKVGTGTAGLGPEVTYNIGRHFHFTMKMGLDLTTSELTVERSDGSRIFESSLLSGYGMLGLGGHF